MTTTMMSIGALAKASGVPVKTIRYYSDEGLLPPRRLTASRYRLYSQQDRARLDMIRTLRAQDVDLATIRSLLQGKKTPRDALLLQLQVVDAELRQLARRRAVLRRALDGDAADLLGALRKLDAVARLGVYERERLLRETLDRPLRGVPIDASWKEQLYRAAFANLPEELNADQYEALLELFDILSDEAFGARMEKTARMSWQRPKQQAGPARQSGTATQFDSTFIQSALDVMNAGVAPSDARAQSLVDELIGRWARMSGSEPGDALGREILRQVDQHDPRAERIWDLVAIIRGQPPPPHGRAMRFVFEALRERLVRRSKRRSRAS